MIHILTNALDHGDAVSTHCILLKQLCEELGEPATLYARHAAASVEAHVTAVSRFPERPSSNDIVIHQFFNESSLVPLVRDFPGRRVMMYHNITPPHFFERDSPVALTCERGLRQARLISGYYDAAFGMSEFSRRDLEGMGFGRTGVFPLLLDLEAFVHSRPDPVLVAQPKPAGTVLVHVGRLAPNKKCDDLLRLLAAYRRVDSDVCLLMIGDDQQHPAYRESLLRLAQSLGLQVGRDVLIPGKISFSRMLAFLRISDAYVSLSAHEGFCAPLLESMALGLPTFALGQAAMPETMGGAGVVFPELDFPRMAESIRETLSDAGRLREIRAGQAARVACFSAERQRKRVKELLRDVRSIAVREPYRPRVSVVINTYNRSWWLNRCLMALRRQTYKDFEVVVVNGPSTDETPSVLARHKGLIRTVNTDSRVLCVSRNLGIAAASGELVAFIDDDAIASPQWLEKLVPVFEDRRAGAAGGLVYRMRGRDIEFRNGLLDREGFVRWDEPEPGLHFDWSEGWLNTVSGNNCIFRRSALEAIGGFDERIEYYHDEADVVMRLAEAGLHTEHVPSAVVYHEAARSDNRSNPYVLNWFAVVKNTLYCAVKNYSGRESRRAVAYRIARRLPRERMLPLWVQWRESKFGWRDLARMQWQCVTGIWTGVKLGLRAEAKLPGLAPADPEAFLPYPVRATKGLAVALLSQHLAADAPGGISTYVSNLARGLRDLGCRVHLISRDGPDRDSFVDGIWRHKAVPQLLDGDLPSKWKGEALGKNLTYSLGVLRKVQDVHARWGLDVVESPNWDAEGVLTALEGRLPVVVRAHSPLFKVAETQGWAVNEDLERCMDLEEILYSRAAVLTGSTAAILRLVGEQSCVDPARRVLIPLGIDGRAAGAGKGRSSDEVRILFVGRLEKRKGIETLLAAIPAVLRECPRAQFTLAGKDGGADDGRSWEAHFRAAAPGIAAGDPRVRFVGEVPPEELDGLYAGCDIFVAPSHYESFGLVYLEAFAHGKPAVGCRVGGVPEVVSDGESGLLVAPGDVPGLKEALCRLIGDASLRSRMGEKARRSYEEKFTVRAMAEKSLALYEAVAKGWVKSRMDVWRAEAQELLRATETSIVWPPDFDAPFVNYSAPAPATVIYGPYIQMVRGHYRVEVTIWIGAAPQASHHLATVDVFRLGAGVLAERKLWAEDFTAGSGTVFDLFFTAEESCETGYEFRVHTTAHVPISIRDITVAPAPHIFRIDAGLAGGGASQKDSVQTA